MLMTDRQLCCVVVVNCSVIMTSVDPFQCSKQESRIQMARIQILFFIIIGQVLQHTHSADDVYSAELPHTVTALTGSCVQISCTFNISDFKKKLQNTKQIYGIWLKNTSRFKNDNSVVVFNSSQNIPEGFSHIEMIGNLTERNCTTVFYNIMKNHSDSYYFRLKMEPDVFKATFNTNPDDSTDSNKTVRITVRDSPHPPELKSSPNVSKYVMENTSVTVICSAEASCPKQPPTLFWSNIPTSAIITTQLQKKPDKTQAVISTMTFNVSYTDHKRIISCTATYPGNNTTVNNTVMLRVQFPPKKTRVSLFPSASVSVGTNVTLTCKSKASPSNDMNYTWYKRGQETPLARTCNLTFNVTQNNTGWYFCTAQNKHGNQTSQEIRLKIKGHGSSKAVIYGCTGLLALLVLSAGLFYYMRTRASSQTNNRGRDQTEDNNKDMVDICSNSAVEINIDIAEIESDELHYGEIDFSKLHTDHMSRKDLETEYAEVQRSDRKRQINSVQKQEELYAQVKKN